MSAFLGGSPHRRTVKHFRDIRRNIEIFLTCRTSRSQNRPVRLRLARSPMKIARFTEGGRTRLGIVTVDTGRGHRRRHGRSLATD